MSKQAKKIQIVLESPSRGKVDVVARHLQPPDTTVDCMNVIGFDRDFRRQVTQRPGLTSNGAFSTSSGSGSMIQAWSINASGVISTTLNLVPSRSSCVGAGGIFYYISGAVIFSSTAGIAIVASSGTVPASVYLVSFWRGRLVAVGLSGAASNWYMSAAGSPLNWDYASAAVGRAIAGNNAYGNMPGGIDGPITALCPWSDDVLVIGGDRRVWAMVGDPTDGGRINLLTEGTGIMGETAWTIAPDKSLWFVGQGGLYRYDGASVEAVSHDLIPSWFQALDRSSGKITLIYDRDREGLWIFSLTLCQFYDTKAKAFWPQSFGGQSISHAVVTDGAGPTDRKMVLLLGSSGYFLDSTAYNDIGTYSLSSYIWLGPVQPFGPDRNAMLEYAIVELGDQPAAAPTSTCNVSATFTAQNTPGLAVSSTGFSAGLTDTYTAFGKQARTGKCRQAGSVHAIKLVNDNVVANSPKNIFSVARVLLEFSDGGPSR